MSDQPLVSAIIIFLNEERFLEDAIESVIAQTYQNWELLLIDDGSTDDSTLIAQSYTEQYPAKIRYIEHANHANKGMSASRNLGVAQAKGRYIAYLDGDDTWLSYKLEQQVGLFTAHPEAVMVYGPLQDWYSWTGQSKDIGRDRLWGVEKNGTHPYSNTLVQPPALLTLFLNNEDLIPSGGLIKREIIEAVGGYEESFRRGYSDYSLFVKICLKWPVFVSHYSGYRYRQHPESSTAISLMQGDDIAEKFAYLNWTQDYLSQQRCANRKVWKSLNQSLWPYAHPKMNRLFNLYRQCVYWTEEMVLVIGRKVLPASLRDWLWNKFKNYKSYINAE